MDLLVTIGLDKDLVQRLRALVEARVAAYPAVPNLYSLDGRVLVESASVAGRWLEPRAVLYYGYFDDAGGARRALALSSTPTFPNVRATLPLDERAMALLLACDADVHAEGRRGFVRAGLDLTIEDQHVLKWGNRHCGEDKARVIGATHVEHDAVIEPFVNGSSERVLFVGEKAWHLRYESADWRKNVGAVVTAIDPDERLVGRARRLVERLRLQVAGVDFIVQGESAMLLEVNAYPGFDDVPLAQEGFLELAAKWWKSL